MKKKKEQKNKIELICWRFEEKTKQPGTKPDKQMPSAIRCATGFVIKENQKSIEISSTKATRGFIDTVKILKSSIASRNEMTN